MGIPTLDIHGVPGWSKAMAEVLCPMNPSHLQLSDCRKLAGNGMHMNVIGSLLLWLFAILEPVA